jgi:hypothetical protein
VYESIFKGFEQVERRRIAEVEEQQGAFAQPRGPILRDPAPCDLRGGRRETKKVVAREDGFTVCLCFITAGPITKLFAWGGEESGGHVLRETTSRGLCG